MMSNHNIDSFVEDIVDQYVPEGIDPYLHVDRRKMMKRLIIGLLEKEESKILTLAHIIAMSKDWENYLYQRAIFYN